MKNILFLTDYGEHAKYIYQYALRIGQHFNASIHFGHIMSVPTYPTLEDDFGVNTMYSEMLDSMTDERFDEETEKLKGFALAQTPKQNHGQLGDYFIRIGDKVTEILDLATQENIDLIVMGMHQKSKIANALFGNLSLKIIEKSNCPVFLVPRKAMFMGINNIAYAAYLEQTDLSVIRRLLEWAIAFDAKLHVVHITKDVDTTKAGQKMEQLEDLFEKEIAEDRIHFKLVIEGIIEKEIVQHIKAIKADMVALTKHDRSFWSHLLKPSMTTDIIGEVDIPVLTIRIKKT